MPVPTVLSGAIYKNFPPDANGNSFFSLKAVPKSGEYLLIICTSGHGLNCGKLVSAVTGTPDFGDPAVKRHAGNVPCLFADQHVDAVTQERLARQDKVGCNVPPGNSWFTMN